MNMCAKIILRFSIALLLLAAIGGLTRPASGQAVNFTVINECGPDAVDAKGLTDALTEALKSKVIFVQDSEGTLSQAVEARTNAYRIVLSAEPRDAGNVAEVDHEKRLATIYLSRLSDRTKAGDDKPVADLGILVTICTGAGARSLGLNYCVHPLCALSSTAHSERSSSSLCPPCQVLLAETLAKMNPKIQD